MRGIDANLTSVLPNDANPGVDESRSHDRRVVGDEERATEEATVTRNCGGSAKRVCRKNVVSAVVDFSAVDYYAVVDDFVVVSAVVVVSAAAAIVVVGAVYSGVVSAAYSVVVCYCCF